MEKENIFIERLGSCNRAKRLISFYRSQKFTDCSFKINGTIVKAHKLILACSSPVFEKMLFGDMAETEIILCDINLEEFEQALEFIYTENIYISSISKALSLFYIANKYLLEDLSHSCLTYIQKNITMGNLILSYEFAEMYNLPDIKNRCFNDMANYVHGVFSSDYHMKPSTLRDLLRSILENVNSSLDKFDLTVNVLRWAATECDFQKLLDSEKNIISILKQEDIIQFLKQDWVLLPCSNCCDPLVMCQCIEDCVRETSVLLDLEGLLSWSADHVESVQKSLKPSPNICRIRKEFKIACRIDLQDSEEFVCNLTANRRLILFGALVNTQMNPTRFVNSYYKGSLSIRICKQNSSVNVVKPTLVENIMYYDSEIYVPLKDLAMLEPNLCYELRISYNTGSDKGCTPVHCYYMSNKLLNQSKDCVISFLRNVWDYC